MLLTLLALAAVLPAFAISDRALETVSTDPGPTALSVSASLDSCGVLSDKVVCKLDVSFNPLPNADSYSASVTSADGSVTDYGTVGAGGTSIWVPYVGAGSYSVKITAYGAPERASDRDGRGHVVATETSRSPKPDRDRREHKPDHREQVKPLGSVITEITGRPDPNAQQNESPDGDTLEHRRGLAGRPGLPAGRGRAATAAAREAAARPRPEQPGRGRRRNPRSGRGGRVPAGAGRLPGRRPGAAASAAAPARLLSRGG